MTESAPVVKAQSVSSPSTDHTAPTTLIVGAVCGVLFAVFLVAVFVMHRRRPSKSVLNGRNGIEDGIFDVVPKTANTDFTIEDFSAAPTGLYQRESVTPPPLQQHVIDDDVMREVDAVTRGPRIVTTNLGRRSPQLDTPWGSKNLIFASPYSPSDTGYHVSDDHVLGSPVYGVPRVGVSSGASGVSPTTPNAAAVAAAVASAVRGTTTNVVRVSGGRRKMPGGVSAERRHSMEWPAEFDDDDPLGLMDSQAAVDLGFGATGNYDFEDFPDVPRVNPNDPRLG